MEHDLNILMIFGIKEKCIILAHAVYCWLLLQHCVCAPGTHIINACCFSADVRGEGLELR